MRALHVVAFVLSGMVVAQEAPKVVSMTPEPLSEVDAKTTKHLVIVFDRPMGEGRSVCGGGPTFPKLLGPPQWKDTKTMILDVELEPDHEYSMSLNSPSFTNFRSKQGVPLVPVPWSFSTLPEQLRPAAQQEKRNQQALAMLMKTLSERYSYHDLRVDDWKQLEKEGTPAILAAKTDRGFASAAAAMLKPTADLHLYLKLGDAVFGTGSRAVDPLFRRPLLDQYVKVAPAGKQALAGRTADGIGYLMVGAWSNEIEPDVIGSAIAELLDTKAMIIDARPNSGGDENLARQVAAWFVDGEKTYAKDRIKERAGKDGFGPMLERKITGYGGKRLYDRPIAVLTSRYVMSSNESFVMMLQQAKDCVVVGQPTYGSSGNPQRYDLGNDVIAFVPCWQDLTTKGELFEGDGLQPDELVPCSDADLKARDPILEKALELLRKKVAPAK